LISKRKYLYKSGTSQFEGCQHFQTDQQGGLFKPRGPITQWKLNFQHDHIHVNACVKWKFPSVDRFETLPLW